MNRNYKFGNSTMSHLASVKSILQDICFHAQYLANHAHPSAKIPDWGYSCGKRTTERQQELYAIGRTKPGKIVTYIDGVDEISAHQEGGAIDFFAYIDGKANYEYENLAIIAALHMQAASDLGYRIEWGGFWESLCDGPHIQLN